PVVLDTHRAYAAGSYAPYLEIMFRHYHEISAALVERFGVAPRHGLFRPRCPKCQCIDATEVVEVAEAHVSFRCERCDTLHHDDWRGVRGKLSWKLDCAARWNLYAIDTETFAKEHQASLGTYEISRFV